MWFHMKVVLQIITLYQPRPVGALSQPSGCFRLQPKKEKKKKKIMIKKATTYKKSTTSQIKKKKKIRKYILC